MKYSSKMAENRGFQFKIEKQTEQAWNTAVKWQRTVDFNLKLKNKLNKHAAEQSKKLSYLKELQPMQFYKNYYIGLN